MEETLKEMLDSLPDHFDKSEGSVIRQLLTVVAEQIHKSKQ